MGGNGQTVAGIPFAGDYCIMVRRGQLREAFAGSALSVSEETCHHKLGGI